MANEKHECSWCGEKFQEQFMHQENGYWFCNAEKACVTRTWQKHPEGNRNLNWLCKKLGV